MCVIPAYHNPTRAKPMGQNNMNTGVARTTTLRQTISQPANRPIKHPGEHTYERTHLPSSSFIRPSPAPTQTFLRGYALTEAHFSTPLETIFRNFSCRRSSTGQQLGHGLNKREHGHRGYTPVVSGRCSPKGRG